MLLAGLIGFAAGMILVRAGAAPLAGFVLIGLMAGLPAGPIMGLAAASLRAETRAAGMGLFYTLFYIMAVASPWAAGRLAAAAGSATSTFDAGIVMLAVCVALLAVYRGITLTGRAS